MCVSVCLCLRVCLCVYVCHTVCVCVCVPYPTQIISQLLDVSKVPGKPLYGMASDQPLILYQAGYDEADLHLCYTASALVVVVPACLPRVACLRACLYACRPAGLPAYMHACPPPCRRALCKVLTTAHYHHHHHHHHQRAWRARCRC